MKRLGRKKKLSKEVKRLAKILNANPSLIASASNRKLLKLKKKNKNLKEEKSMEHSMKLRHQKMNSSEKDVPNAVEHNSEQSKTEEPSADKDSSPKNSSSNASSEADSTAMPPCLTPAADSENSLEQHSTLSVEPPSLQAHVTESKDDAEMNNWRSLPRRAKRPVPSSPVRKPPKKRGRPKVCVAYFLIIIKVL